MHKILIWKDIHIDSITANSQAGNIRVYNDNRKRPKTKRWYWLSKPWFILKERTNKPAGLFGTLPQEPWHPERAAPVCFIQFNCGEEHINTSCKTTRTLEGFNNQQTKMPLFSDKLRLIANKFKNLQKMVEFHYSLEKGHIWVWHIGYCLICNYFMSVVGYHHLPKITWLHWFSQYCNLVHW